MPASLMEYFNKTPRVGVLSTSSKDGKVDSAIYGSPQMTDEKTVVVATGKNRSFENLMENPYALYMIMEQCPDFAEADKSGKQENYVMGWKGIRVYMKLKEHATSGEMLEMVRSQVAKAVGEEGAKMIYALLTFEVYEVRPIVDIGQDWDKSI